MVSRKIFWLSILLSGEDSYILFGFEVLIILLSLVTRLTIVTNIAIVSCAVPKSRDTSIKSRDTSIIN